TWATDAPSAFQTAGVTTCCSASSDCTDSDTCVALAGTRGTIPNKGYCAASNTWQGGDDSSAACTAIVSSGHWLNNNCCGDDSTSEDYEFSGSGNGCCINGNVIANGTLDSTNQFACLEGLVYGCNGNPGLGTTDSSCARRYGYYCNGTLGQNDWEPIVSSGGVPQDCDGTTDLHYGADEGHSTYYDKESCIYNAVYYDSGSGIANQDTGWKCSRWLGPYAADCSLSQVGSTLTLYVEVADEADNGDTGGYVFRTGDYDTVTNTGHYADAAYPGIIYHDPGYSTYGPGVDANEGTYGDYFEVIFDWSTLTTTINDEGTYYTELGLEEASGVDCPTQTCNTEDPNDNEGTCTTSTLLCVPTAYVGTADIDCCPLGDPNSEYPGKDDDSNFACVRCNIVTKVQTEGITGNSQCEQKCGASTECDEYSTTTCPVQGYICNSTCVYVDRDLDESYCTDGSGCTAYSWLSSAALCCGDDTGEDFENTGSGNSCCVDNGVESHNAILSSYEESILCFDGRIRSCNNETVFSFDSDYVTGAMIGDNFCTTSGWTDTAPEYDLFNNYCTAGGFTWFGGAGEKGCCESGEEFVYEGVREESLSVYFEFDESQGNNQTYDSRSGRVGDLIGSAGPDIPLIVTSSALTVKGNAMSFDGIDDYINIKTDTSVELDKNLTAAFWIKPNNIGSNRLNPIDKSYGGEFAFTIEIDGSLNFYHGTQRSDGYYTTFGALSSGAIVNDTWQFIVVTRDVGTRNLTSYYNGKLVSTIQYSVSAQFQPSVSTYDFLIGDGYTYNFGGVIDEVMLWNRTLTVEEISILYRSFPELAQTDILGYWTLDDGSGTTVADSSDNGLDGTFVSDPQWTTDSKSGGALYFDGDGGGTNGDYISFAGDVTPFDVNAGDATSFSVWIKPNTSMTNSSEYFLWKEEGCIGWSLYIENSTGNIGCRIRTGDNACTGYNTYQITTSGTNYLDNTWHHVVCVIDRPNLNQSLYVDGKYIGYAAVDNTYSGTGGSLRIGTQYNNEYPYNGSLDDIRVYSSALNQDEVQYLYNVEEWNKYACENTVETSCLPENECTKNVTDSGIDQYCANGYFTDYRDVVDTCTGACTDQGGSWLGGGGSENCCISSLELWCNETVGVDTLCYGGLTYQCDFWCDILGSVDSYTCTSEADGDCTSSQTCTSQEGCDCFKSEGTTCTTDPECSTNNCVSYFAESISQPSLGKMWAGATGNVCCPSDYCSYDRLTPAGIVDSCAVSTSTSVDADEDGDLDYCLNGEWKECNSYVSASGRANECGCLGAGITINKSDVWTCRIPPVNLVYDSLSCGTACDSDSDLTNIEIVDGAGQCVEPDLSCSKILTKSNWVGNATEIIAEVEVNCPCGEDATCTFGVDSNGQRASIAFPSVDGVTTYQSLSPNFVYGENNVSISCICNIVPAACSVSTPATISSNIELFQGDCVAGKLCNSEVNVSNFGGINLNNSLTLNTYKTSLLFSNYSSVYLIKSTSNIFSFTNNYSCDWYEPTWSSGVGKLDLIYESSLELPEVSNNIYLNTTGKLAQCDTNADCTICCSSGTSCWLNSTDSGDFSCSDGVCCPSGEHFQKGACCIDSERCCLQDDACNVGEWCDNITSGFPQGNFICKDKKNMGQDCFTNRECDSGYCGDGICADPEPVALSEWYECNPYLTNDYCSYESVSGTYTFDPVGCNDDSACSSGYYCYLPRRGCLECAQPNTVYGSLNISDDGLCPSLSCVGNDLDCCTNDNNCGGSEWCDASASCTTCSDRRDTICSSSSCIGTDPDCCSVDTECSEGLKCVTNTCTGNVGETCVTNSTCTGGLQCLGGTCGKDVFIVLSPQEETYDANLGETLKLTLVVSDPQNKQDKYTVYVDQGYVPDSAYVFIDGVKTESFEMGAGEVRKFLVSVSAAKVKEGTPDILTVLHVTSDTNPFIKDSVTLKVDVNPITIGNIPAAPLNSWLAILLIGLLIGIVKN
ncbi:MAG: LamG domain-containing protein, partial [Candidatus Altiarchaeota archaeon]|nr:LamG domain-containing protein [Candidatus Altiarchaeota archaeon]